METRGNVRTGFTLVEMMFTFLVVCLVIGGTVLAFSNYRTIFARQDEGSDILRQSTVFVEQLRNDLQNVALGPSALTAPHRGFSLSGDTFPGLTFAIYGQRPGVLSNVVYKWGSGNITRKVDDEQEKVLVQGSLLRMDLGIESEAVATSSEYVGRGRVWLRLAADFGRSVAGASDAVLIPVRANLFPVRWNRAVRTVMTRKP